MSKLIMVFLLFHAWVPAWAQVEGNDPPPVLELFEAPSKELGVEKELMLAIAGVESGLLPWVLNIEGQSFSFDSKENALEKALEAWEAGRSFDLGLMQVNSWWLRRYGISPETALDPLANIYFGAWILKQEIDRCGDIRSAVGAYHSPTPARAGRYADQVMEALKRGPLPAKSPAGRSQAKPQAIVASESPAVSEAPRMVVVKQKAYLATYDSMKAAATRPFNSMKIKAE